jgi:uncharacterized protein (TIGR00661 family)
MKFLFLVQGEGRGHMTQALSFAELIRSQGHELEAVVVGKSERRVIPDFFIQKIGAEVFPVTSPNFESDGVEKRILLGKTIRKNLGKLPEFWKSLKKINEVLQDTQPDFVVNFYEALGGWYHLFFQSKATWWAIGHQYLEAHPEFHFAKGRTLEKFLFRTHTRITALGADERLALSFLPQENLGNLQVVPPLLRKEIKLLSVSQEHFYLAYMVNSGYAIEVLDYAKKHPDTTIKAFWDKKDAQEVEQPLPNLSFHRVNDQTFLEAMAACKGLVCTAGFESVCEAMYLGKPVLMIPVAGQYEQACNALDAAASGAGMAAESFDFGKFESLTQTNSEATLQARKWNSEWPRILSELIEKHAFQNQVVENEANPTLAAFN